MKKKQSITAGEMVKFFSKIPPNKVLRFGVVSKEAMTGSDDDGTIYTDLINIYCDPPTKREDPEERYSDRSYMHLGTIEAQTERPIQALVTEDDMRTLGWAPKLGKKGPPKSK